jgi:hypothetical protein
MSALRAFHSAFFIPNFAFASRPGQFIQDFLDDPRHRHRNQQKQKNNWDESETHIQLPT